MTDSVNKYGHLRPLQVLPTTNKPTLALQMEIYEPRIR